MTEASLQSKIVEALEKHPYVAMVRVRTSGRGRVGTKWISVGDKNDPDIYGMLNGGQHFEIEVKQKGGKPTTGQMQRMYVLLAKGACVGVAHSIADAYNIIEGKYVERKHG